MSLIWAILKNYIDVIAKIVLGSGLIALSIKELSEARRKRRLRAKIEEQVAAEFFINEYAIGEFQKQAQWLSTYSNVVGRKYLLSLVVMKSVLSSGYFLFLDADLVQLLVEYAGRFGTYNRELSALYVLGDEDRKTRASSFGGEAYQLSMDLKNSTEFNKLRAKYFDDWQTRNGKRIEEFFGPKIPL
jgi:hypothetical protein